MIDQTIHGAANTITTWKVRRKANGKPVVVADIERRIRDLWSDLTDAQVAEVVAAVLAR
jgi:hypothetical protein